MLYTENNRYTRTDSMSSLTMDYSIINHDSDTLLSFDLELNLAEFDMFGIGELENQDDNQNEDRVSPWTELQNNSLDMNAGFDLSYSVMVNPRTVMADMSNYGSISRNKVLESQSNTDTLNVEHESERTETPESMNWSVHPGQNSSESDSDDFYEATESEEENERNINDIKDEQNNDELSQKCATSNVNSTIFLTEKIIQPISSQLTTEQESSKPQHFKINNVGLQKVKIVQNYGQTQQLRRQIYNNNMQARILAQQKSHQILRPTGSIKVEGRHCTETKKVIFDNGGKSKCYPKPTYSYSCLIAMALKNSQTGLLPVSEIYKFMCDHFPYFKTAPSGWKNSVRHNLSLNKCFEKVEKADTSNNQRKGCLWAINSSRKQKMDEEMKKWSTKDRALILTSLLNPEYLEPLENGELKHLYPNTSEQVLSISETESTSTDELGCSTIAEAQSSYYQDSKRISTTNFIITNQDESSKDDEMELTQKVYIEDDVDDSLQLEFNGSPKKKSLIYESDAIKESPIFEINQPSDSSIYELDHPNDSPVYQFSLPSDSPLHQTDHQSKIIPIYHFKQSNSSSNSCTSWSSSNSNLSNSDECSLNDQDEQTSGNSEYTSNQRSNKRQKSFMGIIRNTDYNTQNTSVIEIRRKIPVSRC